jgi:hypothetical protein
VIRQLAGRTLRRLLATAGLARAADLARERQIAARLVDAERARAGRDASARLAEFRTKIEASHRRVVAEHRTIGRMKAVSLTQSPLCDCPAPQHRVYVKHASDPFCVLEPAHNVTALVGFGGAGMTLSFGAAEDVVAMRPSQVERDR